VLLSCYHDVGAVNGLCKPSLPLWADTDKSMLSNTLVTNEVKNASGTEQEFSRISSSARGTVFALSGEAPSAPHRLSINHTEIGEGLTKRRRSLVRFDKTVISTVDSATPVVISAYTVLDAPVGALIADTELKNVMANLNSFLSSLGASTTILYDGTGNGTSCLVSGSL
jgi:hypothetical protein